MNKFRKNAEKYFSFKRTINLVTNKIKLKVKFSRSKKKFLRYKLLKMKNKTQTTQSNNTERGEKWQLEKKSTNYENIN